MYHDHARVMYAHLHQHARVMYAHLHQHARVTCMHTSINMHGLCMHASINMHGLRLRIRMHSVIHIDLVSMHAMHIFQHALAKNMHIMIHKAIYA